MDIQKLYNQYEVVRDYIDKYSYKHCISINEAMTHQMVINYIKYLYEYGLIK